MVKTEETTTVHIRKDVAHIAHTYCVFNQINMQDFVSEVLENHLKEFKKRLEKMSKIGG